MSFDPYNHPLEIRKFIKTLIPQVQAHSHLGVCVHSFTLSYTLESMKCDSQTSLLTHTFASLYFDHEPKAKVAIDNLTKYFYIIPIFTHAYQSTYSLYLPTYHLPNVQKNQYAKRLTIITCVNDNEKILGFNIDLIVNKHFNIKGANGSFKS
jgi:hypothetical protein